MGIKITIIKEENSTLGIKVRALAKELQDVSDVYVFVTNFNKELVSIRTGNDKKADVQYFACIDPSGGHAEIWHRRSTVQDTLVATITNNNPDGNT